jgi:hypothetical protein
MILTIFGYLANEKWLYQQVIDHHLADDPNPADFDDDEEYEDVLEDQRTSAMTRVAERLRKETGIDELRLQAVWVATGQTMLCWQLPGRMRAARRQQEDERRLRSLHHTISAGGSFEEPKYHASHNGSLPPVLQKTQPSSALDAMRL